MKKCYLKITTTIDKEESVFFTEGEMQLTPLGGEIQYNDNSSLVRLLLSKEILFIQRKGDYDLEILLKEGQEMVGKIGLGKSEGEVKVKCYKSCFSIKEKSCLCLCEYVLLFGEEKQRIKLRITARE